MCTREREREWGRVVRVRVRLRVRARVRVGNDKKGILHGKTIHIVVPVLSVLLFLSCLSLC